MYLAILILTNNFDSQYNILSNLDILSYVLNYDIYVHNFACSRERFPGHPVDFAYSQTLRHDNRWWSTSRSLESRPLRSSTSRLFTDRDEEKPRAIRERWSTESVFINSALENFPAGAKDRVDERVRGGEARRGESDRRAKMKEWNGAAHRTRNHRRRLEIVAGCACKSLRESAAEWRSPQFAWPENVCLKPSNFAMRSTLCSRD